MAAWLPNVATAAFTVFSLALFAIALRAWYFTRSPKVLLLSIGFGLMLVKALVLSVLLFTSRTWGESAMLASLIMDLGVLGAFYGAVLKRSSR
ncbi:MAG TPA: hypothetical protein VI818_04820 [Candidatus Thermoplasmatota archaeon]|nr:hypothetical protein [Candidatus Thermoplasmatota archaeon]